MEHKYDVVVIGAGPAGSSAAYHFAAAGVRVALVEHATFPRDKACGDMLGPTAVDELYRIGFGDFLAGFRPQPMWTSVMDIAGDPLEFSVPTGGNEDRIRRMTLPRLDLDAGLAWHAQRVGAVLLEGVSVTDTEVDSAGVIVRTGDMSCAEIQGRLLIVATGSSSRFTVGKSEAFAVRGYYRGDLGSNVVIAWEETLAPGYEWLWPVPGESLYNVGVGTTWERARELGILDRLRQSNLVRGVKLAGRLRGGMLNVSYAMGDPKIHADRTLWIGDAAGLVLPHLGEGIGPGLVSAGIAAEVGLARLEGDRLCESDLAEYAECLRARFGKAMERSRAMVKATQYPNVLKLMILASMGAVSGAALDSMLV